MENSVERIDGEAAPASVNVTVSGEHGRGQPTRYLVAVVVAALIIAGLAAWIAVLLNRSGGGDIEELATRTHLAATLQARSVSGGGTVLYFPDEKKAIVVGDGIAPLDPEQATYQIWQVDGGQARSAGFMHVDEDGHVVAVVPFDGHPGEILSISVEPPGGSPSPTKEPIFAAQFGASSAD